MPCWVSPNIAAEFWGMPLEHVFARIGDGSIRSREENGVTFVDVAPDPALQQPQRRIRRRRRRTFATTPTHSYETAPLPISYAPGDLQTQPLNAVELAALGIPAEAVEAPPVTPLAPAVAEPVPSPVPVYASDESEDLAGTPIEPEAPRLDAAYRDSVRRTVARTRRPPGSF